MLRLALPFVVGVVAWLYADRIPVRGWLAAVSAAGLVGSLLLLREYHVLGAPALAYLCLWAAVQRPPREPATRDLSYGIYIYHWPVVLTLTVAGATAWGRAPFVAVSLALTALAGAASWYGVERRALSWKSAAWVDRRVLAVAPTPVVEGRLSET
jgi:peptidoglycan/LPS O-acetylase OafA/YrhL